MTTNINLRTDKVYDLDIVYVGTFSGTNIKLYCEDKDFIKMSKIINKINEIWIYHDYEKSKKQL